MQVRESQDSYLPPIVINSNEYYADPMERLAGTTVNRIRSVQPWFGLNAHLPSEVHGGVAPARNQSGVALACLRTLCFVASALMCSLACAQQATAAIQLATVEWPPYTGPDLPDGGHSTVIVRAAFGAAGRSMHSTFFPWSRAVSTIKYRSDYIGYYPEYASTSTRKQCFLSDQIGSSRLGFAQRRSKPLVWNSVADLNKYRIGVVHNYVNSESLDAAIAAGKQPADEARDDTQNLKKLLAGRVDFAVIDEAVLEHLMRTNAQLRPHRDSVTFAHPPLETHGIYVCFQRSAEGRKVRDLFNAGLKKVSIDRIGH